MERFTVVLKRSPLVDVLMPWKNFDRASPLLWIFLASLVIWIVGLSVNFLSLFVWIGGFLVAFFVAVALVLFERL